MKAIILAAGRGSRMNALTRKQPKCFTKLNGMRLIDWQFNALKTAGVTEITVVTGYFSSCFESIKLPNVRYVYNESWSFSNIFRSLLVAENWLSKYECLVSYSDIIYSTQAVRSLMECSANLSITYDVNWLKLWEMRFEEPLSDAENFTSYNNYLTDIGGVPSSIQAVQGQYMGLLKFKPEGWKRVVSTIEKLSDEQINQLDLTQLLKLMLERNIDIATVSINDNWFEVDSDRDLRIYQKLKPSDFPYIGSVDRK